MAKFIPKLSELEMPPGSNIKPTDETTGDQNFEANKARYEFNIENASRKRELTDKISNLESKLKKHELKEGMIDRIISTTYVELDNLSQNEFTRRGQKHSALIKQLEALSILHDTLLKYEDMIQKYHKIIIDMDTNKLNSFLKVENLKKEEQKADESLSEVLMSIQDQMSGGVGGMVNPMIEELEKELKENNY